MMKMMYRTSRESQAYTGSKVSVLTSLAEGALVVAVAALADGTVVGADADPAMLARVAALARVPARIAT